MSCTRNDPAPGADGETRRRLQATRPAVAVQHGQLGQGPAVEHCSRDAEVADGLFAGELGVVGQPGARGHDDVQSGELRGLSMARTAIDAATPLHSVRARQRLEPLAAALEARTGGDAQELARMARQVAHHAGLSRRSVQEERRRSPRCRR